MRAYVYTDASLERFAGQFVWLSIDIEKEKNAPFLKKVPVLAVPTMFVLDPTTEEVVLRWVGSATAPQLAKLFQDGRRAVGGGSRDILLEALVKADRLYAGGKNGEATRAYEQLLKDAPEGWSRRGRVTESLLFALQSAREFERCATVARREFGALKDTPSSVNVAATGLDCALQMEKGESRAALVKELESFGISTVSNARVKIAADDRSGLYQVLIAAREDAGDPEGRRKTTAEWAAFLETEAEKASTPDARAVFDSHRLSAYLALEEPQRAVPMLQASERELPDDYNPPARLAVAYRAMKEYQEALSASDRALAKVYGPRRIGVLRVRADIYTEMGEAESARRTIERALALAEGLPEGQRSERTIEALKKKLESME
jgi:tetratricopeptide (TPR) repeat protein